VEKGGWILTENKASNLDLKKNQQATPKTNIVKGGKTDEGSNDRRR